MSDTDGWGGGTTPAVVKGPEDYTVNELLFRLVEESRKMKGALIIIAIAAVIQAGFIALWLLGAITIEFKPTGL